ncbi:MAG TPA: hypothetical protein DDZ66_10285 [Firmicutes bacterium]|jgi:hypothetical protein|nr:hypothetical protein [Bacillota bacterium]
MPRKFLLTLVGVLTLTLSVSFIATALDAVPNVQIDNEYIRIVVNAGETNTGRFSVGTTGGDPDRITDNNKHLIYGGDDPWTSYTTIRVGNQNWVYGGETDRRAGSSALYGEMIQPPTIVDGKIESSWRMGPVQVWQVLSLTRSSTTGLLDTAQIEYHVENIDSEPHMVGVRLMLDTMLGANDGAPFRVDDRGITTDSVYYAQSMPQFWQAFDSLANPQVMSQGTLTGPGVTTPDRVYFTNWGSLADSPWNFDFTPGRDFQRTGEFELDSAIALFWDQVSLAPGEARSFVSYYGLGGVTIAPGELIVGVTSPAEITSDPEGFQTFSIIAYVQNDGQGDARNVVAELKLPPGLQVVGSPAKVRLNDLQVGETKQTGWQVGVHSIADGVFTYEVEVTAENSEPNRVRRNVQVLSPAKLQVQFSGPVALGIKDERYEPATFEAKAVIRNVGGTPYYGGIFEIKLLMGLELVTGQSTKRFPSTIEPGQEVSFKWLLKPEAGDFGSRFLPYSLTYVDERGETKGANMYITIPELKPKVWVGEPEVVHGGPVQTGDYFSLPIWATNFEGFLGADLDLSFDPDHLEIVGRTLDISRGTLFVDGGTWQMPTVSNKAGEVLGLKGDRGADNELGLSYGTLVTIHFRAKKEGLGNVTLDDVRIFTKQGIREAPSLVIEHKDIIIQPSR